VLLALPAIAHASEAKPFGHACKAQDGLLDGNGYEFAKGNTGQLELLGRDSPYYHASNIPFTVAVTSR
jgi:hypothetical protein